MAKENDEHLSLRRLSSAWFAVFVSEYILIFIINAFTIIAFARNRHLRKRSTYLIIYLTVADLLVGAVSGPLHIYHTVTFDIGSGFSWKNFFILTFDNIFTAFSLVNLLLISLERVHATFYPFRHCFIGKWFYLKAILCLWVLSLFYASAYGYLFLEKPFACRLLWASFIFPTLLIIIISYASIVVKMKSNPPPLQFGAFASETKFSETLLIVTVASTLIILPWTFYAVLYQYIVNRESKSTESLITNAINAFFYANSLVNPFIYAIRMQSFRKAMYSQLICKTTGATTRDQPAIELHSM